MKKKYFLLYPFLALILILWLTWYALSSERISLFLENKLNLLSQDFYFQVHDAETTLTGFSVERLSVIPNDQSTKPFQIRNFYISLIHWRLILAQIPFGFSVYENEMEGRLDLINQEINAELNRFKLNQLPFLEQYSLLSDEPSFDLELNYELTTKSLFATLKTDQLKINDQSPLFQYIQLIEEPFDLGALSGTAEYLNNKLTIDLKVEGALNGHLQGTINIIKPLQRSKLDLDLDLNIKEEILKKHNSLRQLMTLYTQNNSLNLKLTGNLSSPVAKRK